MILIGQYDSPFVRRVGIALTLYELPFQHRPWSAFSDTEKIAALNPLIRVPTVVLPDGFVLTDSHLILDYLDHLVPPAVVMFPQTEPARHRALKIAALAAGLADKAVSLFYERRLHEQISALWDQRCREQIMGVIDTLETERATASTRYWFGERIGHADIMIACAMRFIAEAHPNLLPPGKSPALSNFVAALEDTAVFRSVYQPFIAPQ